MQALVRVSCACIPPVEVAIMSSFFPYASKRSMFLWQVVFSRSSLTSTVAHTHFDCVRVSSVVGVWDVAHRRLLPWPRCATSCRCAPPAAPCPPRAAGCGTSCAVQPTPEAPIPAATPEITVLTSPPTLLWALALQRPAAQVAAQAQQRDPPRLALPPPVLGATFG